MALESGNKTESLDSIFRAEIDAVRRRQGWKIDIVYSNRETHYAEWVTVDHARLEVPHVVTVADFMIALHILGLILDPDWRRTKATEAADSPVVLRAMA